MELLCIVNKNRNKKNMMEEKKGGWHTVHNDVIICLRKDLYYCFECALTLIFSFFAV